MTTTHTVQHDYVTQSGRLVREKVTEDGTLTAVMDFVYDESGRSAATAVLSPYFWKGYIDMKAIKLVRALLFIISACFLMSCQTHRKSSTASSYTTNVAESSNLDELIKSYFNNECIRFLEKHQSKEDKSLFYEALTGMQLSEEERNHAVDCYYDVWLRELFNNGLDYPTIQEVSVVDVPKEAFREVERKKLDLDYAIQVIDIENNSFIIYVDDIYTGIGRQAVLYNGEIICSIAAGRCWKSDMGQGGKAE